MRFLKKTVKKSRLGLNGDQRGFKLRSSCCQTEFHNVFFPDRLQPSQCSSLGGVFSVPPAVHWCSLLDVLTTAGVSILEPPAFSPEFQCFVPIFNKFSLLFLQITVLRG
jgi:hypothetical protein